MLLPAVLVVGALAYWVLRVSWSPLSPAGVLAHPFGELRADGSRHHGVDLAAPLGTSVLAVDDGRVEFAAWDSAGGGNVVRVRHDDGTSTHYAHLAGFTHAALNRGPVSKGTVLGWVGMTGNTSGPHLHFAWRDARGAWVDPSSRLGV